MQKIEKMWDKVESKTTVIAFLLLLIVATIFLRDTNFFTLANVNNIFLKAARNGGLLALGMTFVILTSEIDLSVGAVYAVSGVVAGILGEYNPVLGLVGGVLVGVISGTLLGFLVTKLKISSWIASLAMSFGLRGLILVLSRSSVSLDSNLLNFTQINLFQNMIPGLPTGISLMIIIFIVITLLCMIVAKYTKFGVQLYSIGGNRQGAKMMGINTDRRIMQAFILCGTIAAVSGVLLASHSGSASLSAGNTYETFAIAMCAIGGIKLSGGEGTFSGTFLGILIYFMINTIFTYIPSLTTHWQNVIMGVLVLVSVAIQSERFKNILGVIFSGKRTKATTN